MVDQNNHLLRRHHRSTDHKSLSQLHDDAWSLKVLVPYVISSGMESPVIERILLSMLIADSIIISKFPVDELILRL